MKLADDFFKVPQHFDELYAIVGPRRSVSPGRRRATVSLRMIDYLCTTYAENYPIVVTRQVGLLPVALNDIYQQGLTTYGKQYYDCFRRTDRFNYGPEDRRIVTTLGQLMFFRDIIKNGLHDFARKNAKTIRRLMRDHTVRENERIRLQREAKRKRSQSRRRNRPSEQDHTEEESTVLREPRSRKRKHAQRGSRRGADLINVQVRVRL